MKKIPALLCSFICAVLLMGAVRAPVVPTKNFYVNDYAGIVFRDHRSRLSEHAAQLEEDTGAQLVVLTVTDLGSLDIADYAQAIMDDWYIGGTGKNGALILVAKDTGQSYIAVGSGLGGMVSQSFADGLCDDVMERYFPSENYSTGILFSYRDLAAEIYRGYGLAPPEELLRTEEERSMGGIYGFSAILLGAVVIVVLRSIRVNRKYKQKYQHRHDATRRHRNIVSAPSSGGRDEDNYVIPPHGQENIRRQGFIIYRDTPEEDGDSREETGQ